MNSFNYIDLFHGIGGFALGAYWAGMKFEKHFCSDIEPYCQKLYKLRFPDSIQLGDITKINTEELKNKYGTNWILSGGFPCQDISIAGKGAGIVGERSGLWFEYWRLIRDLRPRFAIMENVAALTFRGFDAVLGSLSEIGYNAEWQDIWAEDMGAPHKREREWIVAYACSMERDARAKKQRTIRRLQKDRKEYDNTYGPGEAREIPDPDGKRHLQRQLEREESKGKFSKRQSGLFTERYAGNWSIEPPVGRLAYGIPHRVDRLKGLGNSIVPQIAELLFRQIKPFIEDIC